jgi:DNA-binding NarL/FixJ family response regulator
MVLRNIRVLVAEDNRLVRLGLKLAVESAQDMTLVGAVSNGAEAVSATAAGHPDVILMDLMMPEMNGIDATRAIRQAGQAVSIIILTGYSEAEYVEQAFDAGANRYLVKDVLADELLNAIRDAYNQRAGAT